MNLLEAIEREHSKAQRDRIVRHVGTDPRRFAELIRLFLAGPYRITQRAGWPLTYCVERYPELIQPHLKKILSRLADEKIPVSPKRNIVRLLQFVDLPRSLQGTAATILFGYLQDRREAIAVRVFSMTALARIAARQPGLTNELVLVIEDQLPFATVAFRSRASRLLKQLK